MVFKLLGLGNHPNLVNICAPTPICYFESLECSGFTLISCSLNLLGFQFSLAYSCSDNFAWFPHKFSVFFSNRYPHQTHQRFLQRDHPCIIQKIQIIKFYPCKLVSPYTWHVCTRFEPIIQHNLRSKHHGLRIKLDKQS